MTSRAQCLEPLGPRDTRVSLEGPERPVRAEQLVSADPIAGAEDGGVCARGRHRRHRLDLIHRLPVPHGVRYIPVAFGSESRAVRAAEIPTDSSEHEHATQRHPTALLFGSAERVTQTSTKDAQRHGARGSPRRCSRDDLVDTLDPAPRKRSPELHALGRRQAVEADRIEPQHLPFDHSRIGRDVQPRVAPVLLLELEQSIRGGACRRLRTGGGME